MFLLMLFLSLEGPSPWPVAPHSTRPNPAVSFSVEPWQGPDTLVLPSFEPPRALCHFSTTGLWALRGSCPKQKKGISVRQVISMHCLVHHWAHHGSFHIRSNLPSSRLCTTYELCVAAVTNGDEPGGLKQHECIPLHFCRLEGLKHIHWLRIKRVDRVVLLCGVCGGDSFP